MVNTAQILSDLHAMWTPHQAQIDALMPIVKGESDTTFFCSARKVGKSELAIYALWRHALLNSNSACYYITPDMTHGREVIWSNGRLKRFGPEKYVEKILNNDSRIYFKNGSFIKILGSENWGAANGLTPDFVVYDEFKEFHPQFHTEMNPNRLVRKCPLLIIGTPASSVSRNRDQYLEYMEECQRDADKVFIRRASWENPHISKEWLEKEKARLFANGDEDIWYREYEATIVPGGRSSLFPMFSKEKHVISQLEMAMYLKRHQSRLDFYIATDPATVSTFGVLFLAFNRFSREIIVLNEIYEKNAAATSVRAMYPRIESIAYDLLPYGSIHDDFNKIYDEREAWFSNEVMNQYGVYFAPTAKNLAKKEDGINLIRDVLTHGMIKISETCDHFINEMELAHRSGDKVIKRDDHLIDCLRYALDHYHYNMIEALEKKNLEMTHRRVMVRIEDDLKSDEFNEHDWTNDWERKWN